jgi:hypothetical protein
MEMKINDHDELFENEWYLVRYSGEIPEIALHAAIYFLTLAKDGPRVELTPGQLAMLERAAIDRFREIIHRDLEHANATTSAYRGVARSIVNYRRFLTFCCRRHHDAKQWRPEICRLLQQFLEKEFDEVVIQRRRATILNCTSAELTAFAQMLEIKLALTTAQLKQLLPAEKWSD